MNDISNNRIKYAMKLRNKSQADIVKNTGISKGAISSYLSGRYLPKQTNVYKISAFLNVNPAWLMGYDVPMEYNNSSKDDSIKFSLSFKKKDIVSKHDTIKIQNEKAENCFNEINQCINKYYKNYSDMPLEIQKIYTHISKTKKEEKE